MSRRHFERTAYTAPEVSAERILLGRIALLAREGNLEAARRLLAQYRPDNLTAEQRLLIELRVCPDSASFSQRLASYFSDEMPAMSGCVAIRGRRINENTNPLFLHVAELDLEPRIVGFLERNLGVITVADLDKFTEAEFLAIPHFGQSSLAKLKAALKKAGVLEALRRRKLMYRHDADGGLKGNRRQV